MKVSGGIAKGRKLKAPKTFLRPTSEKVKEALFNILREKVKGSLFVDLYSGTGGIGLDALSRGAARVIFVESNPSAVKILKENIFSLGFDERAEALQTDAGEFLDKMMMKGERFDILFLDPPYHTGEMDRILNILSKGNVLKEEGILIAEHFKKKALPEKVGSLKLLKSYFYGDTVLTLFKKG